MPKNFVGGPLSFGNVLILKSFWITSYQDFVEFFCLASPKIIVGETSCVSEIFWFPYFLDNTGITILSIVFVSQCREICGEPSNDSKNLGYPRFLCIMGEFHDFPWKTFSLTVPKNLVGEHFCVSEKFWYQKILDNRVITILPYFFVSHRQESSRANPSVFKIYSCFSEFLGQ